MNNELTYEIKYYPNGDIYRRIPYKEGRIDGLEEWFWENGNVRARTPYKAGLFHGQEMFYDEDGNITEIRVWKDGELIEENLTII